MNQKLGRKGHLLSKIETRSSSTLIAFWIILWIQPARRITNLRTSDFHRHDIVMNHGLQIIIALITYLSGFVRFSGIEFTQFCALNNSGLPDWIFGRSESLGWGATTRKTRAKRASLGLPPILWEFLIKSCRCGRDRAFTFILQLFMPLSTGRAFAQITCYATAILAQMSLLSAILNIKSMEKRTLGKVEGSANLPDMTLEELKLRCLIKGWE